MNQPTMGGAAKTPYRSGFATFEDFEIPWEFSQEGSQGSQAPQRASQSVSGAVQQGFSGGSESESSGGGFSSEQMDQMMLLAAQKKKLIEDYKRQVKMARYFLPRTLQDIAGQYGAQGSYYSSGRLGEQQEAAKKTQFDLKQAKSDANFELFQIAMQQKALMEQSNTSGRTA